DPAHAAPACPGRPAGISRTRGQFDGVGGVLEVGEGGRALSFRSSLRPRSISTSNEDRDNHLRSGDFFDAENFPEIRFVSTEVAGDTLVGDLTIRDRSEERRVGKEYRHRWAPEQYKSKE